MGSPSKKGKERGGDDFPSERRIVKAVYAFAASARADGSADDITVKHVREALVEKFRNVVGIEEYLRRKAIKQVWKEAAQKALEGDNGEAEGSRHAQDAVVEGEDEVEELPPSKKRKGEKARSTTTNTNSVSPRPPPPSKPASKPKTKPKPRKPGPGYYDLEGIENWDDDAIVPASDDEVEDDDVDLDELDRRIGGEPKRRRKKKEKTNRTVEAAGDGRVTEKKGRAKTSKAAVQYKSAEFIESDEDEGPSSAQKKKWSRLIAEQRETADNTNASATGDEGGDSDASVAQRSEREDAAQDSSDVEVVQPKGKGKQKNKTTPEARKTKSKPSVSVDKDEEEIKRLKSLVVTCGLRKKWSSILLPAQSASQHISLLKTILTKEAGMKGPKFGVKEAKAVGEKRALEKEVESLGVEGAEVLPKGGPSAGAGKRKRAEESRPKEAIEKLSPSKSPAKKSDPFAFLKGRQSSSDDSD